MAENSAIEWTDATWNPVTGCTVLSAGCKHCYAMKLAGTRMKHHWSRLGLTVDTKAGPVWTGEVRFNEAWLDQPLRWSKPRDIFVCAHADLFHDAVPFEWIDQIFAVMAAASQHRFQVLTKRSARMREYAEQARGCGQHWLAHCERSFAPMWPLDNVWVGVSVEDQSAADHRIPDLLATPAAVRWLSCEPLLGPIQLNNLSVVHPKYGGVAAEHDALTGEMFDKGQTSLCRTARIDWVVVGGESGPNARPMHPDWARNLRDQCGAARVPFHFKQWGEWGPAGLHLEQDIPENLRLKRGDRCHVFLPDHQQMALVGKKVAGRLLDGVQHDGVPDPAPTASPSPRKENR